MSNTRIFAVLLLCLLPIATAHGATIFYDSFEDPRIPSNVFVGGAVGWQVFDTLNGWEAAATDFASYGGMEVQRQFYASNGYEGIQWVELDTWSNSWMQHDISGLVEDQEYRIEFAYSARPDIIGGNAYAYDSNQIQFSFGGEILGTVSGTGTDSDTLAWRLIEYTFIYHAADYTNSLLRFEALGASDAMGGLIDAVSVREVIPPVPEPASMALLGLGLAGLGLRRFRRRG